MTGSAADLEAELVRSRDEEHAGLHRLEEFKGRMRAATAHADPLRRRVQEAEQALERRRRAAADGEHALARLQQQVKELIHQRDNGPRRCSPCPVCHADLTVRPVPEGDCPLCLSELGPSVLAQALHAAQDALAATERQLTEQVKAHSEAQTVWEQARIELDARTREEISPLAA
ncbi:hypothetical protein ACWD5V_41205 [Streptomyces sp. NPDC002523]